MDAENSRKLLREVLRLLRAQGMRSTEVLGAEIGVSRAAMVRALATLRSIDCIRGVAGRGYAITDNGTHILRGWLLEERVERMELAVSTLSELVRELLPKAADPSVTSMDIHAGMMDLDPVDKELYDRLRLARNSMAAVLGISEYQLGQNRALRMMADMQSSGQSAGTLTPEVIVGIVPGMTVKTWARIGQTYLAVMGRWLTEQKRRGPGVLDPSVVPR